MNFVDPDHPSALADTYSNSGFTCLAALLRVHGISSDALSFRQKSSVSLRHVLEDDIVRKARRQGMKARAVAGRKWEDILRVPMPAICSGVRAGDFFILVRQVEEKVFIVNGITQKLDLQQFNFFRSRRSANRIHSPSRLPALPGPRVRQYHR